MQCIYDLAVLHVKFFACMVFACAPEIVRAASDASTELLTVNHQKG
jgi:hypothetical protein